MRFCKFKAADSMIDKAMADSIQRDGRVIQSMTEASKVTECASVNAVITLRANNPAAWVLTLLVSDLGCRSIKPGKSKVKRNKRWSGPPQICMAPSWANKPMVAKRLDSPRANRWVSLLESKTDEISSCPSRSLKKARPSLSFWLKKP